jgi:hypothetical protein
MFSSHTQKKLPIESGPINDLILILILELIFVYCIIVIIGLLLAVSQYLFCIFSSPNTVKILN